MAVELPSRGGCDGEQGDGDDEVAILLPKLLEPVSPDILVDFAENIAHARSGLTDSGRRNSRAFLGFAHGLADLGARRQMKTLGRWAAPGTAGVPLALEPCRLLAVGKEGLRPGRSRS